MAAVTRLLLGAATLSAITACGPPPETRGSAVALGIYRRSLRPDGSVVPAGSGAGPRAGSDAGEASHDAPLSVDAAVRMAMRSSASLGELSKRVIEAEAAVDAAGQRTNPDIRVTNVRVARAIEGEPQAVTPRLRYSPERIGEISARQAEAHAKVREARAAVHAEQIAIEMEVRWLFDEIVLLDAEIAATERMAAAQRRRAEQAQDQVATSTVTAVDASLADLRAVEAEARTAERRSRRALALGELLDRMGLPAGAEPRLEGNAEVWPPTPLPSEQTLIESALDRSPVVAGAAAQIDGASARARLERTRRYPWFRFVEVGYELAPRSIVNGQPLETTIPPLTVGAAVELPILSTNEGGVRRAEAAGDAAKRHLEA
jgi:outer membrane protein TolC